MSIICTQSVYSFRKESALVLQAGFTRAIGLAFMIVFINIVTYITFAAYTASGGELSAKKVFTTISLLIGIRLTSVFQFIQNILGIVEARVASVRIQVRTSDIKKTICFIIS